MRPAYADVRSGYILADRDPVTRENRFGGLDLMRLAIPRRTYTDNHMDVIAVALKNVYDRRESITRGGQDHLGSAIDEAFHR